MDINEFLKLNGADLKAMRKKHGLTRRVVAEAVGYKNLNNLYRIEADREKIPMEAKMRLVQYYLSLK